MKGGWAEFLSGLDNVHHLQVRTKADYYDKATGTGYTGVVITDQCISFLNVLSSFSEKKSLIFRRNVNLVENSCEDTSALSIFCCEKILKFNNNLQQEVLIFLPSSHK
jgi:hypothetical protein